jgi:hypothetical protein
MTMTSSVIEKPPAPLKRRLDDFRRLEVVRVMIGKVLQ